MLRRFQSRLRLDAHEGGSIFHDRRNLILDDERSSIEKTAARRAMNEGIAFCDAVIAVDHRRTARVVEHGTSVRRWIRLNNGADHTLRVFEFCIGQPRAKIHLAVGRRGLLWKVFGAQLGRRNLAERLRGGRRPERRLRLGPDGLRRPRRRKR